VYGPTAIEASREARAVETLCREVVGRGSAEQEKEVPRRC
jgi:hypothetical protein